MKPRSRSTTAAAVVARVKQFEVAYVGSIDEVGVVLLSAHGCGRGRTGLDDVDLYAIVRLEKLK